MKLDKSNDPRSVFDTHFSLTCPHCNAYTNITAISIPRFEFVRRFNLTEVGIAYMCDACKTPVFLKFNVGEVDSSPITVYDDFEEIERPKETFEFKYLPETVSSDFREALECYSNSCFNAFAAMCRRTCQSAFTELGADGKSKVKKQLLDIKDVIGLDDDTYEIFEQIIISGHDGAHPNLPEVSSDRAATLLELIKDVLYQLFIRQAKVKEAVTLRKEDIKNSGDDVS